MKNAKTTTKMTKKIVSGMTALAIACTMALAPVNEAGSESFCSPAVITASAASADKLKGEQTIYVTTLNPLDYVRNKAQLVLMVNTEKDVKKLTEWLQKTSYATSGSKNGAQVVKMGRELLSLFDIEGSAVLYFVQYGFSKMNGVSKSAAQAAIDIQRIHKEYPHNGVILRCTQKGSWLVTVNGTPVKVKTDNSKTKKPTTTVSASAKFPKCSSNCKSIVDGLKSVGAKDTSFSYRKKLYELNFSVKNYSGTAKENTKLLDALKKGALVKV